MSCNSDESTGSYKRAESNAKMTLFSEYQGSPQRPISARIALWINPFIPGCVITSPPGPTS